MRFDTFNPIDSRRNMKYSLVISCLLFLTLSVAFGQTKPAKLKPNDLVQFSGVIVTADSLNPIPYVSIMIHNTSRGTVSDFYGFFSFVAKMRDTIEFAALGYKRAKFVIPDTLNDFRCSLIQMLKPDTINLAEVVIFPWPTKEQFKEAFLQLKVPDDNLDRAQKNLNKNRMNILAAAMPMDGSMNFKNAMNNQSAKLYYAGQLPPNNLLNPVAWSKFIQMWQNGEFKKKDSNTDDGEK